MDYDYVGQIQLAIVAAGRSKNRSSNVKKIILVAGFFKNKGKAFYLVKGCPKH